MYSENLANLIKSRKIPLVIFWVTPLIVSVIFLGISFFLFADKKPQDAPQSLVVGGVVVAVLAIIVLIFGALIKSKMLRQRIDFTQCEQIVKKTLWLQPQLKSTFAKLSREEQAVWAAMMLDAMLYAFANVIVCTPINFGLILGMLTNKSIYMKIGVMLTLIFWKLAIPSPGKFMKSFHQNVDPQYQEFINSQNN